MIREYTLGRGRESSKKLKRFKWFFTICLISNIKEVLHEKNDLY